MIWNKNLKAPSGTVQISIKNNKKHLGVQQITFKRNLALIFGCATYKQYGNQESYTVLIKEQETKTLFYDLSFPLMGISLRSENLSNLRGEIAFKELSHSDLICLFGRKPITFLSLTSTTYPLENNRVEGATFYFVNAFNQRIKFHFSELSLSLIFHNK